ncbi:MAG: hypothetical protein AVDCRST_MAG88-4586, partial [uncultured Thermomicrobiales bacterium]
EGEVHLAAADLARVLPADTLQGFDGERAGGESSAANGAAGAARPADGGRPASQEGNA